MVVYDKEVDLDSILKEIGQKGRFQIMSMFLILLGAFFCGVPAVEYLFTTADLPYRCFIPECEANATTASYQTDWVNIAIPVGEKCKRFASSSMSSGAEVCSPEMFNRNETVPCEAYVFGAKNSIIYDFNIPCEDWKRSMIGTVGSLGYLMVLPLTGFLSDRFGRKIVYIICAINVGFFAVLKSYATSYEMYIALTMVGSFVGSGVFSTSYLMAVEMFSKEVRHIAGVSISIAFCFGQAMVGLIAWAIHDWRTLTRVLNYPQLIALIYFFILSESIRWLISKGKFGQAEKVLRRAAKMNGSELSKESLDRLNESIAKASEIDLTTLSKVKEPSLAIQVIKSRIMLGRVCITPLWWICFTLVYYGLSINSVGLAGNMYLNFVLVVLVEIPGYLLAIYAMNKFGRKRSLCTELFVCGVANLAFPFLSKGMGWMQLIIFLVGKLFISGAMTTIYMYTMELYPTQARHSLVAFSSMIGRIGSITAPLTPLLTVYWIPLPNVIFGTLALLSALTVLAMPETLGTTLPDTIAEAEDMKREQRATKINQAQVKQDCDK